METVLQMLARVGQLLDRFDGPLHFRLFVMPTVAAVLAIRAGLRDAREGRPAFLWAVLTDAAERSAALRSALKDIGRLILMAIILDITYQLFVLRWLYPLQVLVVVVACAIVPYIVVRGPVSRLARAWRRRRPGPADGEADPTLSARHNRERE